MIKKLEEKIARVFSERKVAGFAVSLFDKERVIYSRGFGVDDAESGRAVRSESIFRAASITKIVTGILTMRLVEEGRLSLDTPIVCYLPWFTLSDMRSAASITLAHLLSHTSGLPGEYTPDGPHDEGALLPTLKAGIPKLELQSKVDEGKFLYSNWGIRLVSAVIESTMGEKYSVLAKRYVLDPLGMTSSTFFGDEVFASGLPLSLPHTRDEDFFRVSHTIKENYARLAVGGLFSNVLDLAKLGGLLLSGGLAKDGTRVINSASLSAMIEPRAVMSSGDKYGFTTILHNHPLGRVIVGHNGNADPYTSSLFVDMTSGLGAAVMINTYDKTLRTELSDLILGEFM